MTDFETIGILARHRAAPDEFTIVPDEPNTFAEWITASEGSYLALEFAR